MMGRRSWALAVASVALVACTSTDSDGPSTEDAGRDASTADAGNPEAGTTITQTVGASGATITAPGVTLTIPAGALAADTPITVETSVAGVPHGYTALSPLYAFGPSGTTFLAPATVELAFTAGGSNPTVYWSNAGGGFDPLSTTVTASVASALISRLASGFVGSAQTTDAAETDDASADATVVAESGAVDAGEPTDGAAAIEASTPTDAGGSAVDASTPTDAGFQGIVVTIDGVPTTFATNPSVTYLNGISTVVATDNATSTHWQFELEVSLQAQQACQAVYPAILYTHYTGGTADSVYSTKQTPGGCDITVSSTPASVGQHATGVFSGTVAEAQDAGGGSHSLTNGSYDVIR
jgi:hypothetical protein